MLRDALVTTALALGSVTGALACEARDFFNLPLTQTGAPILQALALAYPGVMTSSDGSSVVLTDGTVIELGSVRNISPAQRLNDATLAEQFFYKYPLAFDLEQRESPFFDPGRIRNDTFFQAMYFADEHDARASLLKIAGPAGSNAVFWMTEKWDVSCQLKGALAEMEALETDIQPYFQEIGGSFNWRRISGTTRLSAHSYGISIDINAELGQYWKWTGSREGSVGAYSNKVPEGIVKAMERHGFIWGGKWHHFDGMHFEYRPELILFSRLVASR